MENIENVKEQVTDKAILASEYGEVSKPEEQEKSEDNPTPKETITTSQLRELQKMMSDAREALDTMRSVVEPVVTAEGLNFDESSKIIIQTLIEVKTGSRAKRSETDGVSYEVNIGAEEEPNIIDYSEKEVDEFMHWNHEGKGLSDDEQDRFKNVISNLASYAEMAISYQQITTEYNSVLKAQYDYLNSAEYAEIKKKRFEELKEAAQNEQDPEKKARAEATVRRLESLNTFDYIFRRLQSLGDNEVKSIVDTFFDTSRSEMLMKKFSKKGPRIGISQNLLLSGMNVETIALPDKYHPFNNLFLFGLMRAIAYVDVYDEDSILYVRNTLSTVLRLVNHKFPDETSEETFTGIVELYLDYFMPYREKFIKENNSYRRYLAVQKEAIADIISRVKDDEHKKILEVELHAVNLDDLTESSEALLRDVLIQANGWLAEEGKTDEQVEQTEEEPVANDDGYNNDNDDGGDSDVQSE